MIKADWERRKKVEEMTHTFLSLAPLPTVVPYLSALTFRYEGGGECWLDLLPIIDFPEEETEKVISFFSYINPKWFPPKPLIRKVRWGDLRGGKSRPVSRGVEVDEQQLMEGLYISVVERMRGTGSSKEGTLMKKPSGKLSVTDYTTSIINL